MYNIHILPARFGDSILVEYGEPENLNYILIDGGPYYGFADIAQVLTNITPKIKKLELVIVTHIDIDHIDGIIRLLNEETLPFTIDEIWFNGYKQIDQLPKDDTLGFLQGDYLSLLIEKRNLRHNETYFNNEAIQVKNYEELPKICLKGGMKIILTGPSEETLLKLRKAWKKESKYLYDPDGLRDKLENDGRYADDELLGSDFDIPDLQRRIVTPDKSLSNASSIAFIGAYEGKSCLFAGDATSDDLLKAISPFLEKRDEERISLNGWKLAHHGSLKSTLDRIMQKIDAEKILVSSDGSKYQHPNPETIAKLLKHANKPLTLYFNYKTKFNDMWDDNKLKEKYNYTTVFPVDDQKAITVIL